MCRGGEGRRYSSSPWYLSSGAPVSPHPFSKKGDDGVEQNQPRGNSRRSGTCDATNNALLEIENGGGEIDCPAGEGLNLGSAV